MKAFYFLVQEDSGRSKGARGRGGRGGNLYPLARPEKAGRR